MAAPPVAVPACLAMLEHVRQLEACLPESRLPSLSDGGSAGIALDANGMFRAFSRSSSFTSRDPNDAVRGLLSDLEKRVRNALEETRGAAQETLDKIARAEAALDALIREGLARHVPEDPQGVKALDEWAAGRVDF